MVTLFVISMYALIVLYFVRDFRKSQGTQSIVQLHEVGLLASLYCTATKWSL